MAEDYWVKDLGLAEQGSRKVGMAETSMPVLRLLAKRYSDERPFDGFTVSACLHITKETAVLVRALREGGAKVSLCASNPLSTQDDVAAFLASDGFHVYGFRGMSQRDYYNAIRMCLSHGPDLTIDDGADLVATLHRAAAVDTDPLKHAVDRVVGGTEETTTGVNRLKAMETEKVLRYPIVAVNEALSKSMFDNPLGTGQSALDGVMRATNVLLAGKNVVVCGYGRVGSGIAERARGLGARVIVVEPDPIKALQAFMAGFTVASMIKAAELGDLFITATGNIDVIRGEHFRRMKDGVILANAGHMDVEISKEELRQLASSVERVRENVDVYRLGDGRRIILLAEGRLVNLVCAEGHPSEVMDLSFALQAECLRYLVENHDRLEKKVYNVPQEIDRNVARLKLETLGVEIEKLTEKQNIYIHSWQAGT
ncbi:MAG: adenosylhomocysteinase [Candidatus Caldarchaeum sp.]